MGKICVVKNCQSRRKKKNKLSNQLESLSFFQPKTPARLENWSKALGMDLNITHYLCHLHFREEHIKMYEKLIINGEVKIIPIRKKILKDNASPTIEHQFNSTSIKEHQVIIIKENHSNSNNTDEQELLVDPQNCTNIIDHRERLNVQEPQVIIKIENDSEKYYEVKKEPIDNLKNIIPTRKKILKEASPTSEHQINFTSKKDQVVISKENDSNSNSTNEQQSVHQQDCTNILDHHEKSNFQKEQVFIKIENDSEKHYETQAEEEPIDSFKSYIKKFTILPAFWLHIEKPNALEFMRIDPIIKQIKSHVRLNADLSITVIFSDNDELHLKDKVTSINCLYDYLKSTEKWAVCVGTQIDDKYSTICRRVLVGDDVYKRNQPNPRCKPCRLLRNRLQSRNSTSIILANASARKRRAENIAKQCKHSKRMKIPLQEKSLIAKSNCAIKSEAAIKKTIRKLPTVTSCFKATKKRSWKDTGAVFTFGKSHFADNEPSHFFIKNDPIVAISCGDEHSAVICQNGRVFVFGGNAWGQLGLGHKDEVTRPSCVKWLKPHRAMFVACGRAHTVFVTDTNAVYTVGCNDEGQLGTGDMEHHAVPQFVELLDEPCAVRQVAAGSNHTAILTDEGRVFVCGSNSEGQLGLGEDTRASTKFIELNFVEKIAFVECGYYHTVFITTQGAVFVTGDNENQKLGVPNTATTIYVPEVVPISTPMKSACCGAAHTFLLSMDETKILAFGSNEKGQLGMARDVEYVTEPVEIDMEKMFDGYQLKLVACGAMHTAFVTDNGLLYTCGESRNNKLCLEEIDDADNSNEAVPNQYSPKRVTAMNGFVVDNVACGGCHTLLTAVKGSNADFTNNDFNIVNEETRQISLTELPPLQKIPGMNKPEEHPTAEDVTNSNVEHLNTDNVNGNVNDETGSIDSLEANVSGSHIVNINDLEAENGSTHGVVDINIDEIVPSAPVEAEVMDIVDSMDETLHNAGEHIHDTVKSAIDTSSNVVTNVKDTANDAINSFTKTTETLVQSATDKVNDTVKDASNAVNDKVEVVESFLKKTEKIDPGFCCDERKGLSVPDKIAEVANSPPPKTPILPELLHIPDLTHISPDLSKHSDDGQKSENGQSENETIPCDSDKSSPQTGKTKTQAVMPIVRSEDGIDHTEPENCEDVDVVVNKLEEKGRFARMFQSMRDKENSCMGKGKVIEEKVVETVHKGIDGAEDTIQKVEETVETEIRNQTNSRACTIL